MTSLTNILFRPKDGYFKNTERLISTNGVLMDGYIMSRRSPYFKSLDQSIRLEPSEVSAVYTKFFAL